MEFMKSQQEFQSIIGASVLLIINTELQSQYRFYMKVLRIIYSNISPGEVGLNMSRSKSKLLLAATAFVKMFYLQFFFVLTQGKPHNSLAAPMAKLKQIFLLAFRSKNSVPNFWLF